VFDEVYILFHFNIILKHDGMSSTNIKLKLMCSVSKVSFFLSRRGFDFTNVNRMAGSVTADNRLIKSDAVIPALGDIKRIWKFVPAYRLQFD